ncbi:MAG: helix-turn-helix domain-containing protein [Planctomycetota bacterium]|nr:helix-turn-helix domain-containing protein [Planctomycetota bacterium]MDA1213247.1 helix-turn-helix domain-containing protein [Planctomycetota bacterium]
MMTSTLPQQPTKPEPDTVDERGAAVMIGVSPRTVFTLRTTGELPHIKVRGRVLYLRSDIRSFLERSRQS